jgi:hypothetical protein
LEDPKVTRSTPATPQARRRTVLGAALMASAALGLGVLSACGSGQITQTNTQVASVPGINSSSADGKIVVRDATVVFADQYKAGATVPLNVRLFNNAKQSVKLTGATSDNGPIVLVGGKSTAAAAAPSPSATSSSSSPSPSVTGSKKPSGSASPSESPSSESPKPSPTPTPAGSSTIAVEIPVAGYVVLSKENDTYLAVDKLTGEALRPGTALKNVVLTFTYADGSTTTLTLPELPVTPPLTALPKPSSVVQGDKE